MSHRQYQDTWKRDIYQAWAEGHQNVMAQLPTGGGKSYSASGIVKEYDGVSAVIAHRKELVGQLSHALATREVRHNIIAPQPLIKYLMDEQYREFGQSFITANRADTAVIGVDTLIRRAQQHMGWIKRVGMWITDEAHHITRTNKWGKACEMMSHAYGLGITATPCRADGQGLGRQAQGVFDVLVEGPSMRELIDQGYLTDYRIFAPPSDVDYSDVNVTATGDYSQPKLRAAVQESHLVGDVVEHYKRIAMGKLGITFATDVQTASEMALRYCAAGVPAEVVSAKTPERERNIIIKRFRNRQLMQLVNCDLFGEGFDLPAIEVVSMARKTMSYGLYCQQFGRGLRPMDGKSHAIIIDHAGNIAQHGLPDREMKWSLAGAAPRCRDLEDDIPLRYCGECTQPFQVTLRDCPWCGYYNAPAERSSPKHVDGDLLELDPAVLEDMRMAIHKVDEDPLQVANRMKHAGAPPAAYNSARINCTKRQRMQSALRESITWFNRLQARLGRSDSQCYRIFYHTFGTDMMTAQTLGHKEALALADTINNYLGERA